MRSRAASAHESSLVRAIGVLGLAAGIVNVTVGGGIFRLPADVARGLGPAAPLAYFACAVTMALIVLCFAEAGSRVDLTVGAGPRGRCRSLRSAETVSADLRSRVRSARPEVWAGPAALPVRGR